MKERLLILSIPILIFASCNKKEIYSTRVGFYFEDKQAKSDMAYDLYIDNQYAGKINVYNEEPEDTALLLFRTLDNKRHEIDVRQDGNYLSATYLQITKKKTCSGTNKNKALKVSGVNGAKYHEDTGYSVYGVFK